MDDTDLQFVDKTVAAIGSGKEKVLEILQSLQQHYRYLPPMALKRVCELTDITPSAITGVSTFYSQFRHQPAGQHTIRICIGTACHVKGASRVYDAFRRYLAIPQGQDTDPEKMFTVEKVACLGCCMLAPAIQIDDITYGHLTDEQVPLVLRDFLAQQETVAKSYKKKTAADSSAGEIRICLDSSCVASRSAEVYNALTETVEQTNVNAVVKSVGCPGMSFLAPIVEIVMPDGCSFRYANVQPSDAGAIVLRHFKPQQITKKIKTSVSTMLDKLLTNEVLEPIIRYPVDIRDKPLSAFIDRQKNIATEHYGQIDPMDIDEYKSHDGFQSLKKCLAEKTGLQIINELKTSGLRGRGGAGFHTYLKWTNVLKQSSEKKYIVCNGDEGDPGAFMDRMLIESYPFRVIEGIAIAAYTVGANEGYLYIRAEYPLAIKRMDHAINICMDKGLLGDNILNSNFSLHLKVIHGAGAFVCGEETALIASIQGRRGMPRLRPPYPAENGIWNKPTLINNVETYAVIPWILRNGPAAFSKFGTPDSKGTKVFALAGKVAHGGLIEVPMGITIRQIVEDIGGGIADGKKLKAVQIGGPSGGCVPAELTDISVDFEALHQLGSMMGSGGMVALDESDCMVDIARYFLEFTQDQSCGKCTFCRVGTKRMYQILQRFCLGDAGPNDLDELEYLCQMVKTTSICGLGQTAPNPVLSTLKYFRDEYQAHIEKRCPAGNCRALIKFTVTDDCIGCTLCAQHCPADAIQMKPYQKHEIDQEKCVRCGTCKSICPAKAIEVH